jgi:hypothetical protein
VPHVNAHCRHCFRSGCYIRHEGMPDRHYPSLVPPLPSVLPLARCRYGFTVIESEYHYHAHAPLCVHTVETFVFYGTPSATPNLQPQTLTTPTTPLYVYAVCYVSVLWILRLSRLACVRTPQSPLIRYSAVTTSNNINRTGYLADHGMNLTNERTNERIRPLHCCLL